MPFQDLEVWKGAHELTLGVYRITKSFPEEEKFGLVSQMRRSAYSIPTNIAEGSGRKTDKDYLRFIIIARGSVEELRYQLILVRDLEYISLDDYVILENKASIISKQLNGLMKYLDKK